MSLHDLLKAEHPIWKLLNTLVLVVGMSLIALHGGAELAGSDDGMHTTETIGAAWLVREILSRLRA
jgi:hypothetical protein